MELCYGTVRFSNVVSSFAMVLSRLVMFCNGRVWRSNVQSRGVEFGNGRVLCGTATV